MKEAKKQYYNTEILNCLIDGDIVSTQQIADAVGMSEKSIRNKIFDINEYLQENDMGIIQKKNNLITIYVTRISRKEILA